MKYLIISCDDLGINKLTNDAIFETFAKGICTSSSIIVNSKDFEHALDIFNEINIRSFGIHLNLTFGKPLVKIANNPLCDKKGFFSFRAYKFFLINLYRNKSYLKKIIYDEFDEQIKRLLNYNIKITHIDSHQHIHQSNFIFDIVYDLSIKYKIKYIRCINEKLTISNLVYRFINFNYIKFLIIKLNILFRKKSSRYKELLYFGLLDSGRIKKKNLLNYIDNLGDDFILEVNFHPTNTLFSSNVISNFLNKYFLSNNRFKEKELLLDKKFKQELISRNIKLIDFNFLIQKKYSKY